MGNEAEERSFTEDVVSRKKENKLKQISNI